MSKLYLETDEDITSAVDKLKAAEGDEVSIVVPKRSTLLQSMINQKLLKKAADSSKKTLVLVTTDRLSSHLAGRVGLAVADKLGADAKIPETELTEPDQTDVIDGGVAETGVPESDQKTEDGGQKPEQDSEAESDELTPAEAAGAGVAAKPVMKTKALAEDEPKPSKSKAAKVPDFNAMQKRILWGGLALVAVIVLFVVNSLLTSAKVDVFAKGNQLPITASFTADPGTGATDISKGILKAQNLTSSKDLSEQVPATGTQDVGTKANGSMTVSNATDQTVRTLPAGTQFSSSGKTFVSTQAVTVPGAGVSGGHVVPGSETVPVQAEKSGDSYNLGPASYSVAGQPALSAQGGQMSGGTTKVVTVVAQSDVDKAVADILSKDKDGASQDLGKQAANGYQMLAETLVQKPTNTSSDVAVGAQASNVNVKVTAGYTALAVATQDIDKFLSAQAAKQAGAGNQVYDSGAGAAQFADAKPGDGAQTIAVTATASAGPKIDTAAIAQQIKGKKYGDATDLIGKLPGVDHATITISPRWGTRLPGRASRIKVNIKVVGSGG